MDKMTTAEKVALAEELLQNGKISSAEQYFNIINSDKSKEEILKDLNGKKNTTNLI